MALQFTGNRNAKMASVVAIGWDYVTNKPGLVQYDEVQSLTTGEKEQARENIAAVSYEAQTLTAAEGAQAAENIFVSGVPLNLSGSATALTPALNTQSYLELTNSYTGAQYTGPEIRFGVAADEPYATIKGELITGGPVAYGRLTFNAYSTIEEELYPVFSVNNSSGLYIGNSRVPGGMGVPAVSARFSIGANNRYGFQGVIASSQSSDLPDIYSPGQYVAATAGGYFVGRNNYTGSANAAAYGVYAEAQISNNLWAGALEASIQNTSGIPARSSNPNNVFGSGSAPAAMGVWISNVGTSAPFGADDVTAALTFASATVDHPGKFNRGMVVGVDAIQTISGHKEAILLPASNEITWWDATGANISRLSSDGTNTTLTTQALLQYAPNASSAQITIGSGATGDRAARLYFGASSTGSNQDLIIARSAGANGNAQIENSGTGAIAFVANGVSRAAIASTTGYFSVPDRIGIGITAPEQALHIFSSASAPQAIIENAVNDATGANAVLREWRTGAANNGATQVSDVLGTLSFVGKDTSGNFQTSSYIRSTATAVGASSVTSNIAFAPSNTVSLTLTSVDATFTGQLAVAGAMRILNGSSVPAGGTAALGYRFFTTTNFGMFGGSGVPTLAAAKGSIYLRTDGSTTNDRMYVNTDGSTTWTAVITVA